MEWRIADFVSEAQRIFEHLSHWHIDVPRPYQVHRLEAVENLRRSTFRDRVLGKAHGARPAGGEDLFTVDGEAVFRAATPECPTDKTLTQWLLREYYEKLKSLSPNGNKVQHLKSSFERILDLRMYRRRGPNTEYEREWLAREKQKDPWCGFVAERDLGDLDRQVLNDFLEAAKRLLDLPDDALQRKPPKKGWTKEEAVEEIRPHYRKGVTGRNELHRLTDIPTGTVSNALKILRETEPAKPLKAAGRTQSLENVELSRLVQEQADDKEASPLDEHGDNPRVNTYQV